MYKNKALRRHQYYVYANWPGGIYPSPSAAGTRPGGAIAAAWAIMKHLGEEGYRDFALRTRKVSEKLQDAVRRTDGIELTTEPDGVIFSISSKKHDIYAIGDELSIRGWHLDRQQNPSSLHCTVTLAHELSADQFISDLREAVAEVKKPSVHKAKAGIMKFATRAMVKLLPESMVSKITELAASGGDNEIVPKRSAAMYGMMGELPNKGDLEKLVLDIMDKMTDTYVQVPKGSQARPSSQSGPSSVVVSPKVAAAASATDGQV
jgi:hypothetical protein